MGKSNKIRKACRQNKFATLVVAAATLIVIFLVLVVLYAVASFCHFLFTGLGPASEMLTGFVAIIGGIFLISCLISGSIGLVLWAGNALRKAFAN